MLLPLGRAGVEDEAAATLRGELALRPHELERFGERIRRHGDRRTAGRAHDDDVVLEQRDGLARDFLAADRCRRTACRA